MADTPLDQRKFTDEEVREILKRAVEKAPSGALVKSEGLSLAELKAIGAEVGIEPTRLENAARAVALAGHGRPHRILGGPTVLSVERKVEGRLDPEDTPEVLAVIRRSMGQQGEVQEIHGSLEWSAKGESGERYVTLTSKDDTTTISGSANLSNAAILTWVPAGSLGLIASMASLLRYVKHGGTAALVVCLAVLFVLYPILRTIYGMVARAESDRLEGVVDELARFTEGSED